MQGRECSCAAIELASNRDMSGMATADEKNRSLRTGKGRSLGRITCSTMFAPLMGVGFLTVLMPMSASAQGVPKEIADLQERVKTLEHEVSTLRQHLADVRNNNALRLGPFVSVVLSSLNGVNPPNIIFTGANIHIRSGSGSTNDNGSPTRLGNLIIGYDETPDMPAPKTFPPFPALGPGDRGGSNNLVIGQGNRFTTAAFCGLVAGELNAIDGRATTVGGGFFNLARAPDASISGGNSHTASGLSAIVSRGFNN